jgi:hypothetical protein
MILLVFVGLCIFFGGLREALFASSSVLSNLNFQQPRRLTMLTSRAANIQFFYSSLKITYAKLNKYFQSELPQLPAGQ